MNFKHWGGAKSSAPIFAYLGAESPLDDDLNTVGFLIDNAPRFKALLIYIEVSIKLMCVLYLQLFLYRSNMIIFSLSQLLIAL